jgi:predicted PurR-regulated permease PerM
MDWLKKIKKWSAEKKRIFALCVAIFLTILVLVLNSAISSLWKGKITNKYVDNSPFTSIKESFSEMFSKEKPLLMQALSSSTQAIKQTNQQASTSIATSSDQTNSTSSSLSSSTNVVE